MRKPRANKSKSEAYDKKHQADIDKRLAGLFKPTPETGEAAAEQPVSGEQPDEAARLIDREKIDPNPKQPRQYFNAVALRELGDTIREKKKLIQPIVVRKHPTRVGRYMIVVGERRWRASAPEFGDLPMLQCRVLDLSDEESLEYAIIENDQRVDVQPLERAEGYATLRTLNRHPGDDLSAAAIAARVGKSEATVKQYLYLLNLPENIREKFSQMGLTEKHGRALLSLRDIPIGQRRLWRDIEREHLSGNAALRRAKDHRDELGDAPRKDSSGSSSGAGTSQSTAGGDSGSGITQRRFSSTPPVSYGSGMNRTDDEASKLAGASSQRPDPLETLLRPLASFAAEGVRAFSEITPSADYRRECLEQIGRVRNLLEQMERELNE